MAAYRRVYDSRHLRADCQNRDQLWNPTLGNRGWASFTVAFLPYVPASYDGDDFDDVLQLCGAR